MCVRIYIYVCVSCTHLLHYDVLQCALYNIHTAILQFQLSHHIAMAIQLWTAIHIHRFWLMAGVQIRAWSFSTIPVELSDKRPKQIMRLRTQLTSKVIIFKHVEIPTGFNITTRMERLNLSCILGYPSCFSRIGMQLSLSAKVAHKLQEAFRVFT